MSSEKLLDSFLWTTNTGVFPECEFVEVMLRNKKHMLDKTIQFRWDYSDESSLSYDTDIIKYRQVSREDFERLYPSEEEYYRKAGGEARMY